MSANESVNKDMVSKLKESFSLRSFSSTSCQSSLICNSKVIRLDVNLLDGGIFTASKDFTCLNLIGKSFGNVSKKNEEAKNRHTENSEKSKHTGTSSFINKLPKSGRTEELSNTGDSPRSSAEDENLKCNVPVKSSYQAKSYNSFNQVQTEVQHNGSEFRSFRCNVCMKGFSSKRNVKRHSVLHSTIKHPCETCGKIFQTKENLKRHCRAIHEVKVKSIKCSNCFKAFSRRAELNIHLKKHPDHVQHISS